GKAVELRVRDTASDPARAQSAVDELAGEGVAALLGSPERVESQMAAVRAESLGVPLLELAPDPARRGELTFKLVRDRTSAAPAAGVRAARRSWPPIPPTAARWPRGSSTPPKPPEPAWWPISGTPRPTPPSSIR